jgi:hypothetical protein
MTSAIDNESQQTTASKSVSPAIEQAIATYATECYKIDGVDGVYWDVDEMGVPYFWTTISRNDDEVYGKVFDAQYVIDVTYPSIAVLIDYRVSTVDPSLRTSLSTFDLVPRTEVDSA